MYKIGIDIGSTTVKTVVLSEDGELLFRSYERHMSLVRQKAAEQLRGAESVLAGKTAQVAITGSAGLGVAKASELPFSQEVYATAAVVRARIPDADAVIELGGEDAKIIFFGGALEERMNGSCAGGTGAFIDQMATLLGIDAPELDALSLKHERIYPIASRCGVFAKSDIQPILNQGGRREDIAASIFQAVVDQTVAGLTQGRELKGKIVFLGGPLTFLMGLRERFIETLELDGDHAVFPQDADCYAAIGAAMLADGGEYTYERLLDKLESAANSIGSERDIMTPLFNSAAEYDEFAARHASAKPPEIDSETYTGDAYLGIDAGSTTTKLVLITADGGILFSHYGPNLGDPVSIVREQLFTIYDRFGDRVTIRGSAVTGYGEDLIKNAFNVDMGLVETMAHLRAARRFEPDVDFIIDIGGQDVKCFKIHNGAVDGIMLNEACSSGCGSFVETFAKALGNNVADFAKLGLLAKEPVDLGSRCTVFMNSSVKQAQKDGATVDAISAGLSISVVKNAIYKVIRVASGDQLGKKIVTQGGTFLNDAVLRAFEQEIGKEVRRPTIAGLMGAYGAALEATALEKSTILSRDALADFTHEAKPVTCNGCTNHCRMTVNTFDGGRRFVSGNRCSRPLGIAKSDMPNMMKWKYDRLRSMCGNGGGNGSRGRIGIPFGLNMYENLPFWFELLTRLNFEVVLSPESTRTLYIKGQRSIPSDTVCYPAKLMHGHIEELIDVGVDAIFYPCLPYNFDEGISDNCYNCPVVAYYPELLEANITRLREEKVRYLAPYFGMHKKKGFIIRSAEYFAKEFCVPASETRVAAKAAYEAYDRWREEIITEGTRCLEYAKESGKPVIVVAGRPYHIDPEVNHGIDELITSYDLVLVTEDAVSEKLGKQPRRVLNQWTYHARMYNAARWVAAQENAEMIQLVSFGCGTDAITTDELREILEKHRKLYTQLKIDDINNLGAVRIRVRSLIAAMEQRKSGEVRHGTT